MYLPALPDFATIQMEFAMPVSLSYWLKSLDTLTHSTWTSFVHALTSPCVARPLIAWLIVFTLLMILFLSLGFGPPGVIAGSMAAGFQATMYGAFTPTAGVFATMTSLAMLGYLVPLFTLAAALMSLAFAFVVALAQSC